MRICIVYFSLQSELGGLFAELAMFKVYQKYGYKHAAWKQIPVLFRFIFISIISVGFGLLERQLRNLNFRRFIVWADTEYIMNHGESQEWKGEISRRVLKTAWCLTDISCLRLSLRELDFSSQDTEILFSFYCDSWVWLKCFSA